MFFVNLCCTYVDVVWICFFAILFVNRYRAFRQAGDMRCMLYVIRSHDITQVQKG